MLKIFLHVVFTIAAGDGQPQDNVQNHILFSSQPPLQAYRQAQAFSPVVAVHSIPCRRRNFGDSSNSGWVQVPLPYNQPTAYQRDSQIGNQRDSQIGNQPAPSQLKPQSLTENRAPVLDENKEEERSARNSEYPDEIVELDDQNSVPVQLSHNRNSEDDENLRSGRGPTLNNNFVEKSNPSYLAYWQPNVDSQDSTKDRIDSPDCERIGELDQGLKHDDTENNADSVGRNAPGQVQEQAINLLAKCAQEARNAEEDFEGDSRRSIPNSLKLSSNKEETLPAQDLKSEPAQDEDKLAPHLQNPAKNAFNWGADSHVSLLQHGRVCYACSSYFDISCWKPNATTTIKYCKKENNACLTKTFKVAGNSILIRDCGHTCNAADPYGVNPKIKSCSICNTDMCNSGYTIHGLTALLALATAAVKYL